MLGNSKSHSFTIYRLRFLFPLVAIINSVLLLALIILGPYTA